jgi:hypothetical protein
MAAADSARAKAKSVAGTNVYHDAARSPAGLTVARSEGRRTAKVDQGNPTNFDFGSGDVTRDQTATLKELLAQINAANQPASGTEIDIKGLGPSLKFLSRITGREYKRITENLPLAFVRTVKLLYVTNEAKDIQLFKLIGPPGIKPTMEFPSGASIARDKYGALVIETLSDRLATDIADDKVRSINEHFGVAAGRTPAERLNAHIERTNDAIYRLLTTGLRDNNLPLANAYYRIAREIDRVSYSTDAGHETPVHEALYAYLHGLGFIHFALHHRNFFREVRVRHTIHSIRYEAESLCQMLSKSSGTTVHPERYAFSVNNFHHLVAGYPREINALVRAATKLDTRKKVLFQNTLRAKKILIMHGVRCYDETDLDAPILSLMDIVAALCSVRYQQEVKTEYAPYWPGQVSQGKDPQRHFDKIIHPSDPYQYQGPTQIYLYRFAEFRAAFTETMESFHGWMAFQIARFDAYVRILRLNDISSIIASSRHLDQFCLQVADDILGNYGSRIR